MPPLGQGEFSAVQQIKRMKQENKLGNPNVQCCDGDSFSFAGCGFLGAYHLGVAAVFKTHIPHLLQNARFGGASAGAMVASLLLLDLPIEQVARMVADVVNLAKSYKLGAFDPEFMIGDKVRECFEKLLPEDAHIRCSGRLFVSCTKVGVTGRKPVIFSQYATRQDVIKTLLNSSNIPAFSSTDLNITYGSVLLDGGFSDNIPDVDENTIRICPWAGAEDICPSDRNYGIRIPTQRIVNTQMDASLANAVRFLSAFFLDSGRELYKYCWQGVDDAYRFLVQNNMIRCPDHVQYSHITKRHIETGKDCDACRDILNKEPEHKVLPLFAESFNEFTKYPDHNIHLNWHMLFFNFPVFLTIFMASVFAVRSSGGVAYKVLLGNLTILFEFKRSWSRFRKWCRRSGDSLSDIVGSPFRQIATVASRTVLLILIKLLAQFFYLVKILFSFHIVEYLVSKSRRLLCRHAGQNRNKGIGPKRKLFRLCECIEGNCGNPHRVHLCECVEESCGNLHQVLSVRQMEQTA